MCEILENDEYWCSDLKIVNFIGSEGMNYCQFKDFFCYMESECRDVMYFKKDRWLNECSQE
jgi:hypothetical protein